MRSTTLFLVGLGLGLTVASCTRRDRFGDEARPGQEFLVPQTWEEREEWRALFQAAIVGGRSIREAERAADLAFTFLSYRNPIESEGR